MLQTVRRVFKALVQFDYASALPDLERPPHSEPDAWERSPPGFNCTIVVKDLAMLSNLGPFGLPLLQHMCTHQPVALLPAAGPVCFSRVVLGATTGDWDMIVHRRVPQPVHFASIIMGACFRRLFVAPSWHAVGPGGEGSQVLLVQRKGRRELVNWDVVLMSLMAEGGAAGVGIVTADFNEMTLKQAVHEVSRSHVMVGVHGAGLTNIIFMPLPAALVEISAGSLRPEYFQLTQSLRLHHFDFADVILIGPPSPDPRDMQVYAVDVAGLSRLVMAAAQHVSHVAISSPLLV